MFDAAQGLLITARHVAKDADIFVEFSSGRNSRKYQAKTIAVGKDNLDFAVVRLNAKDSIFQEVEMWVAEIEENNDHILLGYSRDRATPLVARAPLSWQSSCRYEMRANTYPGDSGSPVFSEQGLLVGIVVTAAESGNHNDTARGIATVLPVRCGMSVLKDAVGTTHAQNSWKHIRDSSARDLRFQLTPRNNRVQGWITNFVLAHSIDFAVAEGLIGDITPEKRECPIVPALVERKIGYQRLVALLAHTQNAASSTADVVHARALEYGQKGYTAASRTLLKASTALYEDFIRKNLSTVVARYGMSPTTDNQKAHLVMARAYKGLADAETSLSLLSGNDEDLLQRAEINANIAAILAPKGVLRGSALASYATIKAKNKQYDDAIAGYTAAFQNGFSTDWVKQNYAAAFELKDNVTSPSKAKDYAPLGEFVFNPNDASFPLSAKSIEKGWAHIVPGHTAMR